MSLTGIISVSGLPGLHKVLTHTKTGLIVESLQDGRRRPIYASQKVSALEDISIYTTNDDIPLEDVFKKIKEKEGGKKSLDHKSDPKKLRSYLSDLISELDHDRVYNSDIAKLFQWYNMLSDKKMLDFEEESDDKDKKDSSEKKEKKTTAKKAPAKKAAPKAKATPKASTKAAGAKKINTPRKSS